MIEYLSPVFGTIAEFALIIFILNKVDKGVIPEKLAWIIYFIGAFVICWMFF